MLEKFIAQEQVKCYEELTKLKKRQETNTWILLDEIDLNVAQEKLNLLNKIKSICEKENLFS